MYLPIYSVVHLSDCKSHTWIFKSRELVFWCVCCWFVAHFISHVLLQISMCPRPETHCNYCRLSSLLPIWQNQYLAFIYSYCNFLSLAFGYMQPTLYWWPRFYFYRNRFYRINILLLLLWGRFTRNQIFLDNSNVYILYLKAVYFVESLHKIKIKNRSIVFIMCTDTLCFICYCVFNNIWRLQMIVVEDRPCIFNYMSHT